MLSGNSFSNQITVPADNTATDLVVLQLPVGGYVGGQLTYVTFATDDTDIESETALIIFGACIQADGTVNGTVSTPTSAVRAEGGSANPTGVTVSMDTSRALPVIQIAYNSSLTLVPDTALITYEVNYYGSTWAGGQFPGTVPA